MLELVRDSLARAIRAAEPSFLGAKRGYLHGLVAESFVKSVLRLRATSRAPSPQVVDEAARRLSAFVSADLGSSVEVLILACPGLASGTGAPGDDPLVDAGNSVASRLLAALARGEDLGLNPIFVYGARGTGKSFLLSWFERRVARRVARWSGLGFAAAVSRVLRAGQMLDFRRSLLDTRVFLFDELHRLRGKRRAQQELVCLLDELLVRDVQVVLSARHHPREIHDLGAQLVTRLLAGFVVEVKPPLAKTKRAFLARLGCGSKDAGTEALLRGSRAYGDLLAFVERRRAEPGREPAELTGATDPFDALLARVAATFGLEADELREKRASRSIRFPRQVTAYLARSSGLCGCEIARRLGWRSASSVHYAVRRVRERLVGDPDLRRRVEGCL